MFDHARVEPRLAWEMPQRNFAIRNLLGDGPSAQFLASFDVLDTRFNDAEFRGCGFTKPEAVQSHVQHICVL